MKNECINAPKRIESNDGWGATEEETPIKSPIPTFYELCWNVMSTYRIQDCEAVIYTGEIQMK